MKCYFNSLKNYRKRKAANPKLLQDMALKERKKNKVKRRMKALEDLDAYSEGVKERMKKVITLDYMSSEDELDESFEVRPLRWRSQKCDSLFEELDRKYKERQSKKSINQTVKRTIGPFSDRPVLNAPHDNASALKK